MLSARLRPARPLQWSETRRGMHYDTLCTNIASYPQHLDHHDYAIPYGVVSNFFVNGTVYIATRPV